MRYVPNSPADRQAMLGEIGVDTIEDLFSSIPEGLRLKGPLKLPPAMSEAELVAFFEAAAERNQTETVPFLGAGAYVHHLPVAIDALISRSEFFTAYTPYQAEIAQGTLQAIFEFQTYMTQLTGMDVANASLYDGSTALAEAVLMARRHTGRNRVLMARSLHPEYRRVVDTYIRTLGVEVETVPFVSAGAVDLDYIESKVDAKVGAIIVQSPNFLGTVENLETVSDLAHRHSALAIVNITEAMSLGVLRPPGDSTGPSPDIVVGEAQSLGIPTNFGGPHLGFIATREEFVRQLPGRLVGMSHDSAGCRAFVLTLATREQHIRREKATSNICTNESLCAVMASMYLALVGPRGLFEIAAQNVQKAAYLREQIARHTPHRILFDGPRFNEFVLHLEGDAREIISRLRRSGIVLGLGLGRFYSELGDARLLCVTEVHRRSEMDALVEGLS